MRKFFCMILVFILFILSSSKTYALENFSTDYNVNYVIQNNADTLVSLNVNLTNLSENYYASSYDIVVGFVDIRNLLAADPDGSIKPSVTKTTKGSTIHIPFNAKVVGIGKKLNFHISFNTDEIAQSLGSVWDVNIPGISSNNDFTGFSVSVTYPSFLNKPTFIKPHIFGAIENIQNNTIKFTKEDLKTSGISLAFGNYQLYKYNLNYHLENKNLFTIKTEIALPPTTNYQDVQIEKISPKPDNVHQDSDGNWLATYTISASKKVDILVRGNAKIYLSPRKSLITIDQEKDYLKQQNYWETQNPQLKKMALSLKTPQKIYDYVVNHLTYDFSRVEKNDSRLGAAKVLTNPNSAVCLEFTDLFIGLARAAGIPARAINGYAYTDNNQQRPLSLVKDVLHAWPEYYDYEKQSWIMVDPTWGNTTNGVDYFNLLDFDHFTFVINGQSSSYPIPAGGYKLLSDLNRKDVNVAIATNFNPKGEKLISNLVISKNQIAGLPIKATIKIENNGDLQSNDQKGEVFADKLIPNFQYVGVSSIPPYGYILLPIFFDKTNILTNQVDTIRITVNKNNFYANIFVSPFFFNKWIILGGVLIAVIIFIISIAYAGYRRLPFFRQRKRNNLRGESDKS